MNKAKRGDGMHRMEAIGDLDERTVAVLHDLATGIDRIEDPLLTELSVVDNLIHRLEQVRTLLLRHARERGQSWAAIGAATDMSPDTWRSRYARSIPEGTT